MSDITKRQAYVFLHDGDVIQKHDEFFNGTEWLTTDIDGKLFGYDTCSTVQYRRPIATPEQTVHERLFAEPCLSCVDSSKGTLSDRACASCGHPHFIHFKRKTPEQTDGLTVTAWDLYASPRFKWMVENEHSLELCVQSSKEYADEMMKARAQK